VEDERVDFVRFSQLSKLTQLLLRVDVRQAVVAEDAELAAKAQVDAGRLEIALFPRVDD
jgi:hypothetical protein